MKKKQQKIKELTHLLFMTQQLMSSHLKASNRTIRLFMYLSLIDAKLASAILEAEYGSKKRKQPIWISEIQQKFKLMEQLLHELK